MRMLFVGLIATSITQYDQGRPGDDLEVDERMLFEGITFADGERR